MKTINGIINEIKNHNLQIELKDILSISYYKDKNPIFTARNLNKNG